MKSRSSIIFGLLLLAILGACAFSQPPPLGATEAEIIAAHGKPTYRHQIGNQRLLEYNYGPFGQQTFMARLDEQGKLISYEQVLTSEKFSSLQIGRATKTTVMQTVGMPSEQTYLPRRQLEVWSYPYKQNGWMDAIMHIHFDQAGIVREMVNTPDTRFRASNGNVFGALGK